MREIKFRAWDNHENRMSAPFEISDREIYYADEAGVFMAEVYDLDCDEFEIAQYTGLRDKNGKEIYEGDIIRHYLKSRPYSDSAKLGEVISQVVWSTGNNVSDNEHNNSVLAKDPSAFNSEPCFTTKTIRDEKGFRYGNWSNFSGCEVIGNIYEHPELLK